MSHDKHKCYVDGDYVGEISVQKLDAIRALVKEDRRLYFAQAMNYVEFVFNLSKRIVTMLPWVWFALVTLAAVATPEAIDAIVASVLAGSTSAANVFFESVRVVLVVCAVLASATLVGGETFGLVDKFEEMVRGVVKLELGTPAGAMLLIDERHVFDERPPQRAQLSLVRSHAASVNRKEEKPAHP